MHRVCSKCQYKTHHRPRSATNSAHLDVNAGSVASLEERLRGCMLTSADLAP